MRQSRQMSESIELGVVLALAGGFMDAYSYMCRDQVFSNAQTGNILLMGVELSTGNYGMALRYLFPVLAFTVGIAVADITRMLLKNRSLLHWRQMSVICEAVVLVATGFMPQSMNLPATALLSFACGIQVESFRKIRGNGIATTMCIGNLRNATQNLCEYGRTKDKEAALKGLLYYGIILCFAAGAVVGNMFVQLLHDHAIFVCAAILCFAFGMMFIDKERFLKEQARQKD